jgi:hypothetical protein
VIIEIALGIVLAVFILAYLGEILALGAIVIVIGLVAAALIIAAFVFNEYPALQRVLVLAMGVAIVWALFHFGRDNDKKVTTTDPLLPHPLDEFEAKHRQRVESGEWARERAVELWHSLRWVTLVIFVAATFSVAITYLRRESDDSILLLLLLLFFWIVSALLFLRALTKPIDEPFFRMPGGKS